MIKLGKQLLQTEYIQPQMLQEFLKSKLDAQEPIEPYILPKRIVFIDDIKELQNNIQSHPIYIQQLHSLIHIEYNAIKAYIDTLLRFSHQIQENQEEFIDDMKSIVKDEFEHYYLLNQFVNYGQLPVHNNLQSRILQSQDSVQGRLAVLSIVNEGRGMDTGEGIVQRLLKFQNKVMGKVVKKIVDDETRHVEIGLKWFERLTTNPQQEFIEYMNKYGIRCTWKINYQKRKQAGFNDLWLETFKQWK
ncbi:hypothetical protein pb186bvf_014679 [Paramecium bursaria]